MIPGQQQTWLRPVSTKALVATFTVALICGYLISVSGAAADEQNSASGQVHVSLVDGRLSLEAEEIPLGFLLETLGEESGFKLDLRGDAETLVSPSIVGLPLHQALAQILGAERVSYVLAFAPAQRGETKRKVSKLTVFSKQATKSGGSGSGSIEQKPSGRPSEPAAQAQQDEREAIEILEELLREAEDPEIREATLEALRDIEAVASDL